MDMNVDRQRKDLPKDSDISRLFLGEQQDPKSKFKSTWHLQLLSASQGSLEALESRA